MATLSFAKGPSGPGFTRPRSVSPPSPPPVMPCFDYPVWNHLGTFREIREWYPGRPYFNMRLEDFPAYKALGEPLKLHGPAPYSPSLCGCNRYRVSKESCVCSMECRDKPLMAWFKANPEAFQEKQREMHQWYTRSSLWYKQVMDVDNEWHSISHNARVEFRYHQDMESPLGCAQCERERREYCHCACSDCGSKNCGGCSDDCYDEDYDY